jgi:CRP-like cAMP-binding protein
VSRNGLNDQQSRLVQGTPASPEGLVDLSILMRYPGDPPAMGQAGFLEDAVEEDWARLVRCCERRRCRAGEVVVAEGEEDRALYIAVRGSFAFEPPAGSIARAQVFDAPTVLGELAFLDGLPRAGTLRAASDGELLRLTFAAFEILGAQHPNLGMRILADVGRTVALRLRRAGGVARLPAGSG